jgi:hypothetical protein
MDKHNKLRTSAQWRPSSHTKAAASPCWSGR